LHNLSKMLVKKYFLLFLFPFIFVIPNFSFSQDSLTNYKPIPVSKLFYKLDKNVIGSFSYNYGLNYLVAGVATFAMVGSDADWNWYLYTYKTQWIYNFGNTADYVGFTVPFVAPIFTWALGRIEKNNDLQITGLALGQAAILGWGVSTMLKVFTGRVPPSYLSDADDLRGDFRFGLMQGGVNNGWPSSHTCTAVTMATTLMELYPDNWTVKIGAITYATYIGVGVSSNIHWASDVVSGALIGYAIGHTIGTNYHNLMTHKEKKQAYNFYFAPTGFVLNYKF